MPEQNKDVVEYLDFSIGDGDGTVEYLDFDLSEQQQSAAKPPTPMHGESTVDAAFREAEAETAQEGYSAPKAPSPDTLERFSVEEPLPTFMDSPFPVPGAGMMRVQELNHKIKSTQKRLQALDIRYKANTITPSELQEFKTLIAEIQSDEQKARDEIELYEEFNKKENKRILADRRSMERGDVITSKVQGDLVKIMQGGNPKSISESYHKAKEDGSNPELVKAVEELLNDNRTTTKANQPVQQDAATAEQQANQTAVQQSPCLS